MKYGSRSAIVVVAAVGALAGCVAPTSSSPEEAVGSAREAITIGGVSASLSAAPNGSAAIPINVTVTNNSANPASNWQVAIALNQSSFAGGVSGQIEMNSIGANYVFSPNRETGTLNPGASVTFSFPINKTGSNYMPTIVTVNGVTNGTSGAGAAGTGIDPIAQSVATGAVNIAVAYANNKLPNNGDSNYSQYDSFLWSSHAYVISGNQIQFDPNVPGYAYIPNQAKAELAFMQLDAGVASYLVDGLQSCFVNVSSNLVYAFRPGVLKGFTGGTTTGSLSGLIPPNGNPSGYNPATVVDNFTTVGLAAGGSTITSTLTSTTSHPDISFGVLISQSLSTFSNTSAVAKKYSGADGAACTPFNGPGGSPNPYFTISLNNQPVPTRFSGVGADCNSVCTSTLVMDPVAYMTPGVQKSPNGQVLGPENNPFTLNQQQMCAVVDHESQWAVETVNGQQLMGQFTLPVTIFGVTKYEFQAY